MTDLELLNEARNGNQEARDALIISKMPMAQRIASMVARRYSFQWMKEDLEGEAYLSLVRLIEWSTKNDVDDLDALLFHSIQNDVIGNTDPRDDKGVNPVIRELTHHINREKFRPYEYEAGVSESEKLEHYEEITVGCTNNDPFDKVIAEMLIEGYSPSEIIQTLEVEKDIVYDAKKRILNQYEERQRED